MTLARSLGIFFIAAVLASCTSTVVTEVGAGGSDATSSTGDGTTTGTGTLAAPSPCEAMCEDRVSPGCFGQSTCTTYCEAESPGWDAATLAAFASCA